MMRRYIALLALACASASLLAGCWSKRELTDWGFVQSAAVDRSENGMYRLTTHIYKPGAGATEQQNKQAGPSYVNIVTEGFSVFEAVRKINLELGRKAQWSHMRVLLIGEETVKTTRIHDILDFFYRDHEPRNTIAVVIAEGEAKRYLNARPLIESTLGKQLESILGMGKSESGRTIETTLGDLTINSKKEVPMAVVPFMRLEENPAETLAASGLSIVDLRSGKQTGKIPPSLTPYYMLLVKQYHRGFIEVPCGESKERNGQSSNSFEILHVVTSVKPVISGNTVNLNVNVKMVGSVAELVCTSLTSGTKQEEFKKQVENLIKTNMEKTIELLKREKADVIGIGDQIYRSRTETWYQWKPDWPERFSRIDHHIQVNVKVISTGIETGETLSASQ